MIPPLSLLPIIIVTVAAQMPLGSTTGVAGAVHPRQPLPTPTTNRVEFAILASASATTTGSRTYTDACGPTIPDPTVDDTCDTPVVYSSQPASYGVQCLNDSLTATPINITSCFSLIPEFCANQEQAPGRWLWLTANDCSLGSWLPDHTVYPGAAAYPLQEQCEELIYASMLEACYYNRVPFNSFNIAAVNLAVLPTDNEMGQQVNVGYGSYIISSQQQRKYSDDLNCEYIPPTDYCQGTACYPPSYYQSKFKKPTPCAALGSLAPTFTPA